MLKAEYNSLIYAHESYESEIVNIMMDIALEAETGASTTSTTSSTTTAGGATTTTTRTTSTSSSSSASSGRKSDEINASAAVKDTAKSDENKAVSKTNTLSKVIEKVKALLKKIGEIFDALQRKLGSRMRLMAETDKKFKSMYYKRKSMIKPYNSISVISYKYVDAVLDQPIDKLMKEVTLCLDKLRAVEGTTNTNQRVSDIINAEQGKMIETLLTPYIKDAKEPISSVPIFVKMLVERYRGEKTEFIYNASQIGQIESIALNTNQIVSKCNNYIKGAQDAYNKLKAIEYQIKRSDDEEKIKLIGNNASKAATLYNAYSTLIHSYYELKLEQALNYRIILKKFYQF